MKLKAGTLDDNKFSGSMAEAIEKAFEDVWEEHYKTHLNKETEKDRRVLFVAIAQGVIRYLKANEDAFSIEISPENETPGNQLLTTIKTVKDELEINVNVEQINSENWIKTISTEQKGNPPHVHKLNFKSQEDNKVKSIGTGKSKIKVSIQTE